MEDKKKRIQSAEEEEKVKGSSKVVDRPTKKIHTNK